MLQYAIIINIITHFFRFVNLFFATNFNKYYIFLLPALKLLPKTLTHIRRFKKIPKIPFALFNGRNMLSWVKKYIIIGVFSAFVY